MSTETTQPERSDGYLCALADGSAIITDFTFEGTGPPDGTEELTGMSCWANEPTTTVEAATATPDPPDTLPATGSSVIFLTLATLAVAIGTSLRRLAGHGRHP